MNRIAVFADVQNIYYTCRQAYQKQFNYRFFWDSLSDSGTIVQACAYAIDRNDPGQIKFQNALRHIGFEVKLKPWIQRSDGSAKGDWDVGITIDVLDAAKHADTIVLLSGDGDFDLLMEKVRTDYQRHTIVRGVPALTADSLIRSCDQFNAIERAHLI
ncbi:NYN domain-containing protein [Oceanospirillum sediminis]|uniref:NYN domain-containing protein n=1 Tax=Oceanospirillum sediminis TaxID=2760088 RepID=A0A839IW81_9GAMM|nr:NYN domain-containing protein [Oceanospirillum sediminis]MBB1488709.1 NYN domain-containing protein [Oceanospirillum sediminis]